ncbi:MAG: stage IV sporulation protein A, partial [Clostridia bacterium]|nr:stage IV sporulation protein A [Clostridia bacterium]
SLLTIMTELADVKKKYDKVASAIDDAMNDGYGIVMPSIDDLTLEEPEIVKQPGGYGVKLKASAPSIHMMKADIETEVNPIVGTESQSEELVSFLLKEFEEDPKSIWESNMFGKTLHELVSEGLNSKLAHMPDDARAKIAGTIQRIINEGSGGLICILL